MQKVVVNFAFNIVIDLVWESRSHEQPWNIYLLTSDENMIIEVCKQKRGKQEAEAEVEEEEDASGSGNGFFLGIK